MSRHCILIGHNHASVRSPLEGVNRDISAMHRFLRSSGGGAWEESEIEPLMDPRARDLRTRLDVVKGWVDYVFIYFSGHGAYDNASFVLLRENAVENETILIAELATLGPRARRVTVISDACRSFVRPLHEKTAGGGDVALAGGSFPSAAYRKQCRDSYMHGVMSAPAGPVIVNACSPGQTAGDTPEGGVFTRALLRAAGAWVEEQPARERPRTTSLPGIFERAYPTLRWNQTPTISTLTRDMFPFAIA